MAFARQQASAFCASPSSEAGDVHMHWPTEDASTLAHRKSETGAS